MLNEVLAEPKPCNNKLIIIVPRHGGSTELALPVAIADWSEREREREEEQAGIHQVLMS